MTASNQTYTPDRLLEIADGLERLEGMSWRPNFLKITFPEDEGGGVLTVTYGDLAWLFRTAVWAHARLDAQITTGNEVKA